MSALSTLRCSVSHIRRGVAASAAVLAVVTAAVACAAEIDPPGLTGGQRLVVEPPRVTARLFYNGQTLRISGTVPAGHEVAVVIIGKDVSVDLKVKGKVGGVIWANVGDVTIDNVPSLYLAATSPGLGEVAAATPVEGESVGYHALESRCRVSPSGGPDEDHRVFTEFVKLKESQELYAVAEGGVRLTAGSAGGLDCTAEFFLPPDAPVGSFDIRLLAFDRQGGRILATNDLTVEQAGPAAAIAAMARDRGLLYGTLSVFVALAAGLLAGVLFGLGSKGGH
ncbi:MAG: TIGR02186 family protein [Thermoanaerobaculales bacterium]|nr:TIGR02186 family protein [Thermoanaerobaculales bacterium]